jgi:AraC-like DNA-binding protein
MVAVGVARALVTRGEQCSVDRSRLLAGTGISEEQLRRGQTRIPLAELDKLVERCVQLGGDPALGLSLWDPMLTFGVAALASSVAGSFRHAVAMVERYQSIFVSVPVLRGITRGDRFVVSLARSSRSELAHRAYAEATFVGFVRMFRSAVGLAGPTPRVRFDFPRPAYASRYESELGSDVTFDALRSEIDVELTQAELPSLHHTPELTESLCRVADAQLRDAKATTSVRAQVYRIMCDAPQNHRLSMEELAPLIGLSARSLRRRLHGEGAPYPSIALAALRFHAESLLRDRARSVKEVAFTLGFRDPSAFHRAVRRCSGESPTGLRSRLVG